MRWKLIGFIDDKWGCDIVSGATAHVLTSL